MTVPEDFKLDPVKPDSFPDPSPPHVLKSDIYADPAVFKAVDDHAVAEAARTDYDNFRDLLWNLVFKNKYGELEKARVIFRWLTSKDLSTVDLKSDAPLVPERILNDFKNGRGSYARAFEFLARYAGLCAVSIKGWAKGVDYALGSNITSKNANHSWNAVYINGNWHLIDSSWAASGKHSEGAEAADYDDFYFLSDPANLIYSHFPENFAWQLLPSSLSAEEFENLPHLKSHFFTLGLEVRQQRTGVLYTQDGILTLTLGFSKQTAFTYKVTYGDEKSDHVKEVSLSKYVLQEMTDNRLTYYFRAPAAGTYHLTVFARNAQGGIPKGSIIFKSVAEYKVVCDEAVPGARPFPYCSDSSWGSDVYVRQYPVIPSIKSAILLSPTGKLELSFQKAPNLHLYARLVREEISFDELKSWLSFEEGKGQTLLKVNIKVPGEYGLEIFAKDPEVDGEIFSHFSQYLVISTDKEFAAIFGFVVDREDLPKDAWAPGHHVYEEAIKKKDLVDAVASRRAVLHDAVSPTDTASPVAEASPTTGASPAAAVSPVDGSPAAVASPATATSPKAAASPEAALSPEEPSAPSASDLHLKIYAGIVSTEAPSGFEAARVLESDVAAKRPSRSYKPQKLFYDFAIFRDVDNHAVEVSKIEHGNFRDLIWHLIYARNITDELEKARAIFVFLSSKDLGKINFDHVERDSPEEMLVNLKDGRTTYARAYETLCSYAGLNCETVTGYAKGADYRPGLHFFGDEGQHSWNAVYVNGSWQLVDCHWAARRLVGKQVAGDNVRYELDDYYFMPESSQLIFTHYPQDAVWQLLEEPISLQDFENLVPVKSNFFKYGLNIVSHRDAVIQTDGEVTIVIGITKGKNLAFTFSLSHFELGEDYRGIPLNQFAMNYQQDGNSYFRLRLPERGSYQLVLYAKEVFPKHENAGMFGGVCEYEIIVDRTPLSPLPFPPCAHSTWGPGDSFHSYEIIPHQRAAVIRTVDGRAEIRISMKDALRFTAKLKSALVEDDLQLTPFLLQRIVGDEVIFLVRALIGGEFGLDIYANDPLRDGQSLHHVYQYLILCDEPYAGEPFPALPTSYLGAQPQFEPLGLAVAGNPDPFVVLDAGDLQTSFKMAHPTRMSCQLIYCSEKGDQDLSEYTLQQSSDSGITYVIKLPQPGFYKVQFYALPASDSSESLPGVYNVLVDCRSTFVSSVPFPKQYGIWRDGCYLYEPLDGHLQSNRPSQGGASTYQHVFFKTDVPRATSVVIVVGEEWFTLTQKPDSTTWSGEVLMEGFWGRERKLSIVASYDSPPARYGTLLEYSI